MVSIFYFNYKKTATERCSQFLKIKKNCNRHRNSYPEVFYQIAVLHCDQKTLQFPYEGAQFLVKLLAVGLQLY